jgi:hypothetical protein
LEGPVEFAPYNAANAVFQTVKMVKSEIDLELDEDPYGGVVAAKLEAACLARRYEELFDANDADGAAAAAAVQKKLCGNIMLDDSRPQQQQDSSSVFNAECLGICSSLQCIASIRTRNQPVGVLDHDEGTWAMICWF